MLRLIITLAVCTVLVHCDLEANTEVNQVKADGKEPAVVPEEEEELAEGDTKCYICNSKDDDFCEDTFDEAKGKEQKFLKSCMKHYKDLSEDPENINKDGSLKILMPPPANVTFYCTKTVTKFEFSNTLERYRWARKCGYALGKYGWTGSNCYFTTNALYSTNVCKCEGLKCNSATTITSTLFIFVTALIMLR